MSAPSASALERGAALAGALPWLERFHGATIVVKLGGNALESAAENGLLRAFAEDVVFLRYAGLRPVVVHGGGPQVTALLDRLGIESAFAGGHRVTSREAMGVVRMVLVGQVQRDLVGLVNRHGPFAVGLSGEDARLFTAEPRQLLVDGRPVDLGQVGDVVDVQPGVVLSVLEDGRIPVVSSIACGTTGDVYNVNADTAAAALAIALGARKLVLLTDVPGLYRTWRPDGEGSEPEDFVSSIAVGDLERLLPTLDTGMIPKMEACVRVVRGGVGQAHVIDGRLPHALLGELFSDDGVGTEVHP